MLAAPAAITKLKERNQELEGHLNELQELNIQRDREEAERVVSLTGTINKLRDKIKDLRNRQPGAGGHLSGRGAGGGTRPQPPASGGADPYVKHSELAAFNYVKHSGLAAMN